MLRGVMPVRDMTEKGLPSMDVSQARWRTPRPTWFDSLLFLALMSGPPKFRLRDVAASLTGAIDPVVLLHLCVWFAGGLWVLARVCPSLLTRASLPGLSPVQVFGALFIFGLSLSMWISPGFLLTGFMLGQFAVMLGFSWVFVDRFGQRPLCGTCSSASACSRWPCS